MLVYVLFWRFIDILTDPKHCIGNPGWGVLPDIGFVGMCGLKGFGFPAVLVINEASSLVINRVWFLHFSLKLGMFLEEAPV